jgi:hypothetical protein
VDVRTCLGVGLPFSPSAHEFNKPILRRVTMAVNQSASRSRPNLRGEHRLEFSSLGGSSTGIKNKPLQHVKSRYLWLVLTDWILLDAMTMITRKRIWLARSSGPSAFREI